MNPAWNDPPGPRNWDPWLRRLLCLAVAVLGAAVLIHFDVDVGPSTLDRLFEIGTGRPSPTRHR